MNKKQFLSLLLLLVVVGGLGLYVSRRNNGGWSPAGANPGQPVLADFNVNDVARVRIQQNQALLDLRKKSEIWTVAQRSDYAANFQQISEFILKMHDLKAVQTIEAGPSQRARLEVEEPGKGAKSGTLVEFLDSTDKPVRRFILGKSHTHKSGEASPTGEGGWPDGRYILPALDSAQVDVVSDPLSSAEPKPDQWLDKNFFKIEKPSSIALASTVATNSWKISRDSETAEWKLDASKPGEQIDSAKTSSFASALANPSFSDLATNLAEANSNLAAGLRLTFQTFDHFTYDLVVSTNAGENYLLTVKVAAEPPKERTPGKDEKPDDKKKLDQAFADQRKQSDEKLKREQSYEKWVYQVSKWSLDSVLKERGQLLVEKKPEPKPGATNAPPPEILPQK
jgi:hypothetical protein